MSISDLLDFGNSTRFDIDWIRMVSIDRKLAARLGLVRDEEWLQVCGIRHDGDDDSPVCWTEYYINRVFAAVGRILPRHPGPVFPLIEDMFGQSIVAVHQQISATLISAELAAGLNVEAGEAALEVRRTYKTAEETTAQITVSTHPASRFRHSMTIRRVKT
jgi:DNA-binding GntR family transcriptional regulator